MRQSASIEDLRHQISCIENGQFKKATAGATLETSACEKSDDYRKALSKIVRLVKASDKSVLKIRMRLTQDGYGEEATETAIEKALGIGLLDDSRFADTLIRSRISQGKGAAGIERELKENDIDPNTIDGWPYKYIDDDGEFDRAYEFLVRHPPRSKNKREGAFRKLVSKGYPSSIASTAARIWSEQQRNESY